MHFKIVPFLILTGEITAAICRVTEFGGAIGCGFIDKSSGVVIDTNIVVGSSQHF